MQIFDSLKPLRNLPPNMGLLLASVLLVCLPHFLHMPVWLSIYCLVIIFWRGLYEIKKFPLPGKILRFFLLLASLVLLLTNYSTLLGRQAGSAMLVLMVVLKLLEIHNNRDVIVVLYICFFTIITGFLFDQSIIYGAYMLGVVWLLLATMITFNHPLSESSPSRNYPGTYSANHIKGYLRRHFRLAAALVIQSLPLMLLLFFLFPRLPGPLWSLPQDSHGGTTGLTDRLEPGRISDLSENPDVAFRVMFDGLSPVQNQLYWRGPVLSRFDGQRWTATEPEPLPRLNLDDRQYSNPVHYTVTMEPSNQSWMFALEFPASIPSQAKLSDDMQLLSATPLRTVTRYDMISYLNYRYDTVSVLNLQSALELPEDVAPKTRVLVDELQAKHGSSIGLVQAVLDHFRQQPFYYTRKPPKLYGDITDDFLFETQRGYCVHYASAFAVMMRLADIPARIISGYQGGEINPLSDYMIVRQSDAHAWVEIWLTGHGWLRIDPTSVIPDHRIEDTEDVLRRQPQVTQAQYRAEQPWLIRSMKKMGYALDAVNNHWNTWVVGYDHKKQLSIFASMGIDKLALNTLILVITLAAILVIFLLSLLVLKKKKAKSTAITAAYARFCKKLARLGFKKHPQESATGFAQRVIKSRADLKPEILPISRLYNQLRYARQFNATTLKRFQQKINNFRPSRRDPGKNQSA